MGCGASASPKGPVGHARTKSGESLDSKKALKRRGSGDLLPDELHRLECKEDDMGQVFTIQQAFPTVDSAGRRHSYAMVPEELSCTTCGRFLVTDRGEKEFWACRKCWAASRMFVQCISCHVATGVQDASQNCKPMSPQMQRRLTAGNLASHSTPSSPLRRLSSPSRISHAKTSASLMRRSTSITTDASGAVTSDEEQERHVVEEPLKRRRSSLQSKGRRRRATAEEVSMTPKSASPPRRQSADDALTMRASTTILDTIELMKLSGTWDVEIREKGSSTRREQRILSFNASGGITGTGTSDCMSLDGCVRGINMDWLEVYPWGSIHVTVKFMAKTRRLAGTFKASDGGEGKIDMAFRLM